MTILTFPKGTQCSSSIEKITVPILHVPAAGRANNRSRFAPEEKSAQALMPAEAVAWVDKSLNELNAEAVFISGPGDPLAAPESTMETLRLLRGEFPQMDLGITTLGLGGQEYTHALAENGVKAVSLLVDAVDANIVQELYAWIRPGKKTIPLAPAAEVLLEEQVKTTRALKESGFTVDIRTTVYPGINDEHIEEIAQKMADLGADSLTLSPCLSNGKEGDPPVPGKQVMDDLCERASRYLAVHKGVNNQEYKTEAGSVGRGCSPVVMPKATEDRQNVAVVSSNGMEVDLHLGQAIKILIYGPREDGLACLLETRPAPEPGGGGERWHKLADTVKDCFVLLTASAGESPRKILSTSGISVIITDDNIEGLVDVLYGGGKKGKCKK